MHNRFPVALLVGQALLTVGLHAETPRSALSLIHESRVAVGRGDLGDARTAARQAVEIDPAYADAWKQLGRVQMLARQPDDALRALDTARQLKPGDAEIEGWLGPLYRDLGWWHWAKGDIASSIAAFNDALKANVPRRHDVLRSFQAVLAESDHRAEALQLLESWGDPDIWREIARANLDQGRLLAAEPALTLLHLAKDDPVRTDVQLAHTRAMLGACEDMSALIPDPAERAAAWDDPHVDLAIEAILLCNNGTLTSRLARLQALEREPQRDVSERMRTAARTALAHRNFDRAFRIYDRLLAREPDCRCYLRAASAAEALRGTKGAAQFLAALLPRSSDDAVRAGIQGRLARLDGLADEAAAHYARSLSLDPAQNDVQRELFFALVELGREEEARRVADALAGREAEGETELRPILAEMWSALADHELALAFWGALAERHPGSAYYTVEWARTLLRVGRRADAIARLEALTARVADVPALELLARLLIEDHRKAEALQIVEQALALEYTTSLLQLRTLAGGISDDGDASR
ncbi:MAG TPA: tetratricopeptide repeat protein [Kiritimatiellia bacterium]|nr:tetratricopeptide repeat protein [Kiritimatiellia bacterium]